MGLHDRDYGRYNEQTPWDRAQSQGATSVTIVLIVINVVLWFLDAVTPDTRFSTWFAVEAETLARPWMWFQFLSYGFLHDPNSLQHIAFNMIGLFFFGRIMEQYLGRMEFLRFYLVAIVAGGIIAAVSSLVEARSSGISLAETPNTIGASGAVVGTIVLFACTFPKQEVLLFFVLPIKAWIVGVFYVAMDLAGAIGLVGAFREEQPNTAFTVHLAGAFLALGYHYYGWNLKWLDFAAIRDLPGWLRQRSRRMQLKIHDPDKKLQQEAAEADRILEKIHRSGESSLTASERKTLERYSRRQREKRQE